MGAVHVERLDDRRAAEWNRFVAAAPEGTFFHLADWKKVIEHSFGHECPFLAALQAGVVTGVLPLVHVHSPLFGNALISTGFCVYGGPIAADPATRSALDSAARDLAEDYGAEFVEYRSCQPSERGWPTESALYATFRKPLPQDPDRLMASIPRKRRAVLRKAMSSGLTCTIDPGIERFYPLYAENMHRHGTPAHGRRFFQALLDAFPGACRIVTASREGLALSSVLSFTFRDTVLPYYAGGGDTARQLGANDLMYWSVMRQACRDGLHVFDFGRSKRGTGAFAYKKTWGYEPEPLHYEYLLLRRQSVPDRNPLNPKYRLRIALWRRLPLRLANWLGPTIAAGLG